MTMTDIDNEDPYICVGICMADPDSGYCLGCGRPPPDAPDGVAESAPAVPKMPTDSSDPGSPE